MKNNKLKVSLVAFMLLCFYVFTVFTAFAEQIKLDDLKIGSTVTREGISFG